MRGVTNHACVDARMYVDIAVNIDVCMCSNMLGGMVVHLNVYTIVNMDVSMGVYMNAHAETSWTCTLLSTLFLSAPKPYEHPHPPPLGQNCRAD